MNFDTITIPVSEYNELQQTVIRMQYQLDKMNKITSEMLKTVEQLKFEDSRNKLRTLT